MIAAALCAALAFPAGAQADFGSHTFEAGTCNLSSCTYASPRGAFYTQAAGHPPWGITSFEVNTNGGGEPEGTLKRIRVDVPAGLAADPEAPGKCSRAAFDANSCPESSIVGNVELTAYATVLGVGKTIPATGTVYNLEQPPGLPLDFGINVATEPLVDLHLFLEGHVDSAGDYHEYFEINNIPQTAKVKVGPLETVEAPLKTVKSKLNFNGRAGGNFLTLPSECSPTTTSHLEVESYEGAVKGEFTHTPVGVEGCEHVPFQPQTIVTPEVAHSDLPDGATIAVKVPQNVTPEAINTADIKDVHLQLPEGMTLNPPAAGALGVCTAAQFASECPASAKVGTVDIETDLPAHSLTGTVYLGDPAGATITGPPFNLYLIATSPYGVTVRLQGQVSPNEATGRLETTFLGNPRLPFSELVFKLDGGPQGPVANPLACGTQHTETLFTPWTGLAAWKSVTPFATDAVGGGACPPASPFSLGQAAAATPNRAGASSSFTFSLARGDGQQYLSRLSTELPAGLVGLIPSVALCGEPQAAAGACPASSQIGTASVTVGAGGSPLGFTGPVYLTGPYAGAPYGLSVPIEAAAGHFDLGRVVTRAAIGVDTYSSRVIVTSSPPTIVKGVPLRLKTLAVTINRPGFMLNPTSCGALSTDSMLNSTTAASDPISSPFSVSGCNALAFAPSFSAASSTRTSRANGAMLSVTMAMPAHDANLRSVVAQLPLQLPSRLSTLQKACLAATYDANPRSCPAESLVGQATVSTPVLPRPLSGPAYLVSHGGAAFPDLDLLLEGNGVRIILVGNTNIHNGITTSTFASIPDVPVSTFTLQLPTGPHSALASYGNLCSRALIMPTTLTAQNGAQVHQSTRIAVAGCGVRIVRRRRVGRFLLLTLQTYAPGRVIASGHGVARRGRTARRPATFTLKLPIARAALRKLHRRHHRVRLAVSVLFTPLTHGEPTVRASTVLILRH